MGACNRCCCIVSCFSGRFSSLVQGIAIATHFRGNKATEHAIERETNAPHLNAPLPTPQLQFFFPSPSEISCTKDTGRQPLRPHAGIPRTGYVYYFITFAKTL